MRDHDIDNNITTSTQPPQLDHSTNPFASSSAQDTPTTGTSENLEKTSGQWTETEINLLDFVEGNCILSYTNFTFPLFFDLILCSFILISFRLCDALAFILVSLFCYSQPSSLHPPSSVPHPPFCPLSPSFPSSILHHSLTTSFHILVF